MNPGLVLAQVVLLSLASYRGWRLMAEDSFPLAARPRKWLLRRWGPTSLWTEWLVCAWCAGAWWSIAVVAITAQVTNVPLPVLQAMAVSTLVGLTARVDVG